MKMINKKIDEATLCFGDALASKAVVGPGERTLLLALGSCPQIMEPFMVPEVL